MITDVLALYDVELNLSDTTNSHTFCSRHATTTEPARLEPVLRNKRGHNSERTAHRDEEWPPLATTGESPSTETKTQHSNQSINQSLKKS